MSILSGLYHPDDGKVYLHGKCVDIRSPRQASELGIGMVHQHFMLVEMHTVAENVTLGSEKPRFVLNLSQDGSGRSTSCPSSMVCRSIRVPTSGSCPLANSSASKF